MLVSCTFVVKKKKQKTTGNIHFLFSFSAQKADWTLYVPEEGKHLMVLDTLPSSCSEYHYMFSYDDQKKKVGRTKGAQDHNR